LQSKVRLHTNFVRSAGIELLGWVSRHVSRRIPRIIVYHRFGDQASFTNAQSFELQLRYLKDHFNVVHLSRLVAALCGIEQIPTNCIVLTVDDGHADFYHVAFPLLNRYKIPCTLFVTTNFVSGLNWLWPDKLSWILAQRDHFPDLRVANQMLRAGDMTTTRRLCTQILGLLQELDADAVDGQLDELARQLGIDIPDKPVTGFEPCSWDHLREMENSRLIEVGGHTRNHPILSHLDPPKLPCEIDGCLEDINRQLGARPRSFCYPNGKPSDFSDIVREAVVRSGFVSACATFYDEKHLSDRFALRRFSASSDVAQFHKAATGLQYWGARVLGRHNADVRE
jgi:peptidoglycan/xylan/chitin deacetylase (PgdA/CDA1 family)